jgi:hypothetical protein
MTKLVKKGDEILLPEWVSFLILSGICILLIVIIAGLTGCVGKIPSVKTYDQAVKEVNKEKKVVKEERVELELDPGKSEVLAKGVPMPYNGMATDRQRGIIYGKIKSQRNRLIIELYETKKASAIKIKILKSSNLRLKAQLDASTTWWQRSKGEFGLAFGLTIGVAALVGLVYALTGGKGLTTSNSNPMILKW